MEYGMEDFWYEMEMEWKKLPVWNTEKSSSIPFHTMPCIWEVSNDNIAVLLFTCW